MEELGIRSRRCELQPVIILIRIRRMKFHSEAHCMTCCSICWGVVGGVFFHTGHVCWGLNLSLIAVVSDLFDSVKPWRIWVLTSSQMLMENTTYLTFFWCTIRHLTSSGSHKVPLPLMPHKTSDVIISRLFTSWTIGTHELRSRSQESRPGSGATGLMPPPTVWSLVPGSTSQFTTQCSHYQFLLTRGCSK